MSQGGVFHRGVEPPNSEKVYLKSVAAQWLPHLKKWLSLTTDYNKLHSLHFLDCFIKESLRLWGLNFFDRRCNKDYYLAEMNFMVPKGMQIQVGSTGIMRDEKYFKNALHFDPKSHFGDDGGSLYNSSFFAFGQGPRSCIGMRFAYTMVSS